MISRRRFLTTLTGGTAILHAGSMFAAPSAEILYNGITLGNPWPPRWQFPSEYPTQPPYLADPPEVIPIDVGRQLFVDDFLIEDTTLERTCHHAVYDARSPVLRPERPWELRDGYADRTGTTPNSAAMPFSDGVFYDPHDRVFKMWYMGGYGMSTCLALSEDGIAWQRPMLDVVPGTNIVEARDRDSSTVWLDLVGKDRSTRYKMATWADHSLTLLTSADGVHWREIGETGRAGDRTTFFYNPFRRVWTFSIRSEEEAPGAGRFRRYWEASDFASAREWNRTEPVAWVKADSRDWARPDLAVRPELYNLDCVAYESVLLGLFAIWRGESSAREKINEVVVGFSRDGFHWHRPERTAFLPVSDEVGSWNWANVQSAGGACLVVGDQLYFYVSGRQGRPGTNAPGQCSTGLATLRRDGFASMDWLPGEMRVVRRRPGAGEAGTLTTRPLRFTGDRLFVNADTRGGEIRAEVLDAQGRTLSGYTRERCTPISSDGTKLAVQWQSATLGALAGEVVRFRFTMTRGRLYAFWVSPWPSGESRGFPAAGGPAFAGPIDTPPR